MKKYRITCKTDPYHASSTGKYYGCEILERNWRTPVKWVHDDNFGMGYTLEEARRALMHLAREDAATQCDGKIRHKYLSLFCEIDVFLYEAEEF